MRSPVLRGVFLLLLGLWFGVFVPSHERGRITVPGAVALSQSDGCCPSDRPIAMPACSSGDRSSTPAQQDTPPTNKPVQRCAVCYIVATLQTPGAVVFYEPQADWIQWLSVPIIAGIASVQTLYIRYDRGPPQINLASSV
jgi:hypothetical protein